jgi:hypothetical protein
MRTRGQRPTDAKERQPLQDVTKPPDKKRRRIGRRILRVLLILFVVIVIGLSIALYNPVRTVASLTRVDDYPLFVMKCTRNSPAPRGARRPTGPWRCSRPPKQSSTVWSVVYSLSTGRIQVALGRDYKDVHTLQLPMKAR